MMTKDCNHAGCKVRKCNKSKCTYRQQSMANLSVYYYNINKYWVSVHICEKMNLLGFKCYDKMLGISYYEIAQKYANSNKINDIMDGLIYYILSYYAGYKSAKTNINQLSEFLPGLEKVIFHFSKIYISWLRRNLVKRTDENLSKIVEDGSRLASMFANEDFILTDLDKARDIWIELATLYNDALAIWNLGKLYEDKKDYLESIKWYTKSKDDGNNEALKDIERVQKIINQNYFFFNLINDIY